MYLGSTDVDCIPPHVLPSFMQIRTCESKKMLLDVVSLHFKIQGGSLQGLLETLFLCAYSRQVTRN